VILLLRSRGEETRPAPLRNNSLPGSPGAIPTLAYLQTEPGSDENVGVKIKLIR